MIEIITDTIKLAMFTTMGVIFGFTIGLTLGIVGLGEFISKVPTWIHVTILLALGIGLFSLIIMFKNNQIEGIKNENSAR